MLYFSLPVAHPKSGHPKSGHDSSLFPVHDSSLFRLHDELHAQAGGGVLAESRRVWQLRHHFCPPPRPPHWCPCLLDADWRWRLQLRLHFRSILGPFLGAFLSSTPTPHAPCAVFYLVPMVPMPTRMLLGGLIALLSIGAWNPTLCPNLGPTHFRCCTDSCALIGIDPIYMDNKLQPNSSDPGFAAADLAAMPDGKMCRAATDCMATSTSFWTIFGAFLSFTPPTRAVWYALLSTHAGWVLIGDCDPMLCPNWGFRHRRGVLRGGPGV